MLLTYHPLKWKGIRLSTGKRFYVLLYFRARRASGRTLLLPMCRVRTFGLLERETGLEPATSSLGRRPSIANTGYCVFLYHHLGDSILRRSPHCASSRNQIEHKQSTRNGVSLIYNLAGLRTNPIEVAPNKELFHLDKMSVLHGDGAHLKPIFPG
jgi:hypothetical protein